MIYALVAFAFIAGLGAGTLGGIWFSRTERDKSFELITRTSDSLVRSALFPGLPQEAFEPQLPEPAEEMYRTQEAEELKGPAWLEEEGPLWAEADASR